MGEKEGRNTRVLSLFVRLSYGDILKKKEEARHYQVTERTIQRDLETIRSVLEEERKMGRDDRMLLYDREHDLSAGKSHGKWNGADRSLNGCFWKIGDHAEKTFFEIQ